MPGTPAPSTVAAHAQAAYRIRLDWGSSGAAAIGNGADVAVVVDVLSFTTTLSIAASRGTRVHPFAWRDGRARQYAAERGAVLAVGRTEAARQGVPVPSLSPAHLVASAFVDRLVLPSPNGSSICAALGRSDDRPRVVGASLRNRRAVARWLAPRLADGATLAVVPAGERWEDGALRPAVEDLWGAGAVLDALPDQTADMLSPEAGHALASYRAVAGDLAAALGSCASGGELVGIGFGDDVSLAADVDADDVVPVLTADGFTAAARRSASQS